MERIVFSVTSRGVPLGRAKSMETMLEAGSGIKMNPTTFITAKETIKRPIRLNMISFL